MRELAFVAVLCGCDRVFLLEEVASGDSGTEDDGQVSNAGSMLVFDGTDDYLPIVRPVAESFTIEVWIRTNQANTTAGEALRGTGVVYGDAPGSDDDFSLTISTTFAAFTVGNPDISVVSTSSVVLDRWTHVAATRDASSGEIVMYINGRREMAYTHPNKLALTAQSTLTIGWANNPFATEPHFKGEMDELRLWTVARSETEIHADHARPLAGDEPGLVGYYRFDDGAGPFALDSSTTKYDAALGGGDPVKAPAWADSTAPVR